MGYWLLTGLRGRGHPAERDDVGDVYGEDVSQDDGDDGYPPDELNGDKVDVYEVAGGAEDVPVEAERVG